MHGWISNFQPQIHSGWADCSLLLANGKLRRIMEPPAQLFWRAFIMEVYYHNGDKMTFLSLLFLHALPLPAHHFVCHSSGVIIRRSREVIGETWLKQKEERNQIFLSGPSGLTFCPHTVKIIHLQFQCVMVQIYLKSSSLSSSAASYFQIFYSVAPSCHHAVAPEMFWILLQK